MKHIKRRTIIIATAFIAALLLILFVFLSKSLISPKDKVFIALSKAAGADSMLAHILDTPPEGVCGNINPYPHFINRSILDTISSYENGMDTNCTISITRLDTDYFTVPDIIGGLSFNSNIQISANPNHLYSDIYFKYMTLKMGQTRIYADDASICINVDELGSDVIAFNAGDTLTDLYNSSLLNNSSSSTSYNGYFANTTLGSLTGYAANYLYYKEHYSGLYDAASTLLSNIEVKDTHRTKSLTLNNNQVIQLTSYEITIAGDDLKSFLDNYASYASSEGILTEQINSYIDMLSDSLSSNENYTFYAYLDNNCCLRQLTFDNESQNLTVNLDLLWTGTDYLCDNFLGSIQLELDNICFDINITNEGRRNSLASQDNTSINLVSSDGTDVTILLELTNNYDPDTFLHDITITDNTKGNIVRINACGTTSVIDDEVNIFIDELTLSSEQYHFTIGLQCELNIKPLTEAVPAPTGRKYYILDMTNAANLALIDSLKNNSSTYSLVNLLF